MVAEMCDLYWDVHRGLDVEAPEMPKAGAAEPGPPGAPFWSATAAAGLVWRGNEAVARRYLRDQTNVRVKRMYVVPEERGMGMARVPLHALGDAASGLGYRVARLDTGPKQPNARGLSLSEGYRPVANFNGNPVATSFGEKRLAPAAG